jgi:pre-rRNA-processing protein TSR3
MNDPLLGFPEIFPESATNQPPDKNPGPDSGLIRMKETPQCPNPTPYPKTLILRDRRERKERCTIWPLREHPSVRIVQHPWKQPPDLANYVLLWHEGPELSEADAEKGLLLVDGSWRWAQKLSLPLLEMPKRSLRGLRTAYPRSSKLFDDPDGGLATVEALYSAHHILSRDTKGFLDHYYWAKGFLHSNLRFCANP